MSAYCEEEDLLIGQIRTRLPPTIAVPDFIENASLEIDARLGFTYVTPFVDPTIEPPPDPAMPLNQWNLIRMIAIKLASGRIILAATAASQESTLHAYGYHLVRDAEMTLMAIANGDVRLSVQRVDSTGQPLGDEASNPQLTDPYAYIPGASNFDAVSGVEAFTNNYMPAPSLWPVDVETWYPGG